jgi:hypothetical protein
MRGDNSHAEQLAASDFLAQCEHEVGMARKGQLSIQEAWQVIVELHDEYRKRVFFHERTGEELGE